MENFITPIATLARAGKVLLWPTFSVRGKRGEEKKGEKKREKEKKRKGKGKKRLLRGFILDLTNFLKFLFIY